MKFFKGLILTLLVMGGALLISLLFAPSTPTRCVLAPIQYVDRE